jgi:hypothetical protein
MKSNDASYMSSLMWGRLAARGGLLTRVVNPWERRLTTGAQLGKLPHKK